MPIKADREYRLMPVMAVPEKRELQLIDSDYYVEGFATTFNQPYRLWSDGNTEYWEQIDARAFDEADMTDVIFLHNHEGICFARNKMRAGVAPTLILQPQETGLFVAADLGMREEGRNEYAAITGGLVYQMSFAFSVRADEWKETTPGTVLRTITEIRKVYDVSSVDMPANPNTVIDSATRSAIEGYIDGRAQELARAAERDRKRKIIKILSETR